MRTIVDTAADFVLAVERVFGVRPRVLDGSRAVQIDDVRLSLEAGERELCLIRMHGLLEEYLAIFEVRGDIEVPLLRAKEFLAGGGEGNRAIRDAVISAARASRRSFQKRVLGKHGFPHDTKPKAEEYLRA